MTTAIVATETVVLALLTVLVIGLLRSHGEILRRLHSLDPNGSNAEPPTVATANGTVHDVAGPGLYDDVIHIAIEGAQHPTLLAFLSSGCLTCRNFWTAFENVNGLTLPHGVRLVVVVRDIDEESISALRKLAGAALTVVMSSKAWTDYAIPGAPYFVFVDGARVRGEGTGATWEQVLTLLLQAIDDAQSGDVREARIDRELLAHGIRPGDPSLYA
jgi:hypothetical protein